MLISPTYFRPFFVLKNRLFLANGARYLVNGAKIWLILGHKFGRKVLGRMLVKLNGEFFAKQFARASFCLLKKFNETDPRCQFHQHRSNCLIIQTFKEQLFWSYILSSYFFQKKI